MVEAGRRSFLIPAAAKFLRLENALGKRLASVEETGEEAPQLEGQRFEAAARTGRSIMSQMPERRTEPRDECEVAARIELAVAVALTNIAPGGVRLHVADGLHLPDEFDLLIPLVDELEQRCRIKAVWRQDGAVGGTFLSIGELAADPNSVGPATDAVDAAIEGDRERQGRRA